MTIDRALLAKLVCPLTRMPLRYDRVANELVSDAAGLAYPIRGRAPILLVEAARVVDPCAMGEASDRQPAQQ